MGFHLRLNGISHASGPVYQAMRVDYLAGAGDLGTRLDLRRPQRLESRALQGFRSYHFASLSYVASFSGYPPVDVQGLRRGAVEYLEAFPKAEWHSDPVCSLVRGERLTEGEACDTVDAFGRANGRQLLATAGGVDAVLRHVRQLRPQRDLRKPIRQVEKRTDPLTLAVLGNVIGIYNGYRIYRIIYIYILYMLHIIIL